MRSIHHKLDAVTLDKIHHIGPAFFDFINPIHDQPGALQDIGSAMRCYQFEIKLHKEFGDFRDCRLIALVHADEYRAGGGQRLSGG